MVREALKDIPEAEWKLASRRTRSQHKRWWEYIRKDCEGNTRAQGRRRRYGMRKPRRTKTEEGETYDPALPSAKSDLRRSVPRPCWRVQRARREGDEGDGEGERQA